APPRPPAWPPRRPATGSSRTSSWSSLLLRPSRQLVASRKLAVPASPAGHPQVGLALAQPLGAVSRHQDVLLDQHRRLRRHQDRGLDREHVALLDLAVGRVAVALPPGPEDRAAVVDVPADLVTRGVADLGVAVREVHLAGGAVDLVALHARS